MMEKWFTKGICQWYRQNKRELPWRNEKDPYRIWLSEVILQQTQVKQGLSYYLKFRKNYPTVRHLAIASQDQILKDWQGLGYYSRARNMHAAAQSIVSNQGGIFPSNYEEIRKLKGIGDYTAAAIASFAYDLPYAVVDGNVYRVLSRVFGMSSPVDSLEGKKLFQEMASALLDKAAPAEHNQAIMEFGSQFCRPAKPDCPSCIFKNKCAAYANNKVGDLPLKQKKIKIRTRFLNYVVLLDKNNHIVINKRHEKDIWRGLYDFPLIESQSEVAPKSLLASQYFSEKTGKNSKIMHISEPYKHILTHQKLFARFYVVKTKKKHPKALETVCISEIKKTAFPRLIEKYLNDCKLPELF
jgi:A/G-specific adenine glycosylase